MPVLGHSQGAPLPCTLSMIQYNLSLLMLNLCARTGGKAPQPTSTVNIVINDDRGPADQLQTVSRSAMLMLTATMGLLKFQIHLTFFTSKKKAQTGATFAPEPNSKSRKRPQDSDGTVEDAHVKMEDSKGSSGSSARTSNTMAISTNNSIPDEHRDRVSEGNIDDEGASETEEVNAEGRQDTFTFTDKAEDKQSNTMPKQSQSATTSDQWSDDEQKWLPLTDNNIAIMDESQRWSRKPCDGTKCLYGETSIIHDGSDIEGVHPNTVGTSNNKVQRKATVEDVNDDGDKVMTYLEDTAARG
ncbi:hypothetical protein FIBSPDRAFT_904102 [Athelia psychrophila]|uniref:Uncharacterized protein n=1 Tax=Athelia psychrophila TaxID=1759441 RepID=A0A167V5Y9_9AGAM|nr:hypothetical protein FIBSPDRAFT_904102 [Fibularhizoctonia sp. CBS 109695]